MITAICVFLFTVIHNQLITEFQHCSVWLLIIIKLATFVKGELKAPSSIATKLKCRGGTTQFPGLIHFTLDPYLIVLSVKQGGIKYHF